MFCIKICSMNRGWLAKPGIVVSKCRCNANIRANGLASRGAYHGDMVSSGWWTDTR